MSVTPNFFILGAPKSGTTALSEYLRAHPEVLFSTPKEASFFHTDFTASHRLCVTLDDYLRCFRPERDRTYSAVGEGTVWYLYSQTAVPNILSFNSAAKFIVMVRNPIELAHSLHSQLLYGGAEDVESFDRAWRLQDSRRRGESIPRYCPDAKVLQYGAIGKLGEQLGRLYGVVPRDRVLVIEFDDFRRSTRTNYRAVLRFLGITVDDRDEFRAINTNKVLRSRRAAQPLYLAWWLKNALGIKRSFGVWEVASRLLGMSAPRRPVPPALREELAEFFRPDVALLAELLGRDLSHWR